MTAPTVTVETVFEFLEAHRRNAQKSRGPKTDDCKSYVSINALKHGLTARTVVLLIETAGGPDRPEHSTASLPNPDDVYPPRMVEALRELRRRMAALDAPDTPGFALD
jgi:hypothetical protein